MPRKKKVVPPNPIESLRLWVHNTYPDAATHLDEPFRAESDWWLDVHREERHIAVQWHAGRGFGISVDTHNVHAHAAPERHAATQGEAESTIREILG